MNDFTYNPIVLALDLPSQEVALSFVEPFQHELQWVKVGMRLFYASGPQVVRALKDLGFSIFLDLKLHDIPNTVAEAVASLLPLQVDWLTLHASGGEKMMRLAQEQAASSPTKLVAVTCLTSHSATDLQNIYPGLQYDTAGWVCYLAEMALKAGITHLVCSPHEVALIRQRFGNDVTLITPGVRPKTDLLPATSDDQTRIMAPDEALQAGANYLVIGRPLLKASHPVEALHNIKGQLSYSLSN